MIVAAGLTVSKIGSGQRSQESGHDEIDCNSLNMQLRTIFCYI